MALRLVEILDRSVQGRTRPFYCRGEDGHFYYVKGRDAGKRSLICEWMGGSLATAFGLTIPHFTIAYAPAKLLQMHPEGYDLGPGPLFASRATPNLAELSFASVAEVPREVRRDVAVFDWWVRNEDRSLTAHGGNPNLLWDPALKALQPIDHNLAFDGDFSPRLFLETHVFARDFVEVSNDIADRSVYAGRLQLAMAVTPAAWDDVPQEWLFEDDEETVATDFSPIDVSTMLATCSQEMFWRVPA